MRKTIILPLLLLPLGVFLLGNGSSPSAPPAATTPEVDVTHVVSRGDFDIDFSVPGQLDAYKHHRIRYKAEAKFGLTIAEIIPTATRVKKGDMIVRFYNDAYVEERDRLQADLSQKQKTRENTLKEEKLKLDDGIAKIAARRQEEKIALDDRIENARTRYDDQIIEHDKKYRDALENLDLMQSDFDIYLETVESGIKSRTQNIKDAQEAYENYLNLDGTEKRTSLREEILKAEEAQANTEKQIREKRYAISTTQANDTATRTRLENELAQLRKRSQTEEETVDAKRRAYRRFVQTEYPKRTQQLDTRRTDTRLDLNRFIVRESRNMVIKMRHFRDQRDTIERLEKQRIDMKEKLDALIERENTNYQKRLEALALEEENLTKAYKLTTTRTNETFTRDEKQLLKAIEAMKKELEALVITAPIDGIVTIEHPRDSEYVSGSKISRGATLATIPDLSRFLIRCDVSEAYRARLSIGMKASLRSNTTPPLTMDGTISEISPTSQRLVRWDQNSPKVYPITLSTDIQEDKLMPGMSIQVHFQLDKIEDVLFVPLEAIHEADNKSYCTLVLPNGQIQEREVHIGRTSASVAEIKEGLQEHDRVRLHRPATTDE